MDKFNLREYLKNNPLLKENKVFSVSLTNKAEDKELVVYVKGANSEDEALEKVIKSDKIKQYPEFIYLHKTYDLDYEDYGLEDEEEEQFEGDLAFFDVESLAENNPLLKEELTWYVEDENADIRYENDEYQKEVRDKIKIIHPDISDEDLDKIIIMTGEQYSREEDFHGKNIPSNHFVEAAVEIYQTDVMTDDQYNAWQASLA